VVTVDRLVNARMIIGKKYVSLCFDLLLKLVEIWWSSNKNKMHSFFRHGVHSSSSLFL